MKRIALALLAAGVLAVTTASARAEEPSAILPAPAISAAPASQAAIVPVDRYVYRYRPGWFGPRYYGSYYYEPYWGSYSPPRYYYSYPEPYPYYGYYPGGFGFYYSGPRRAFSFGF